MDKKGMTIGIIYSDEKYRSLKTLNKDMIHALKKKYNIKVYKIDLNFIKTDEIDAFYKKVDFVINFSSKCINFTRRVIKPTIFLGHAWMDHGAGINLYYNRDFFCSQDSITFASKSALAKYKYVYKKGVPGFLLPYFTSIRYKRMTLSKKRQIKKKYNISKDKKILIYTGRLCQEKNIEDIIEIYKNLNREDVCLLILGSFSDEQTYGFGDQQKMGSYKKKISSMLKINHNQEIKIIEKIEKNDLVNILSSSDVFISTSKCYEEDFGLSIIEAMRLGIPVVCSDRGGYKDLIVNKKTGLRIKTRLSNNNDVELTYEDAIQFINNLLDNAKIYKQISLNAKKKAETLYGEDAFIKNIDKIIQKSCSLTTKHNKEKLFLPRLEIKKIFDKAIKKNRVKYIYKDNPDLFRKLYEFYISK